MAPTTLEPRSTLDTRQFYGCQYYGTCSGWYYWGRWILLGVIIVIALLLFWLFICMRNRRRSKSGLPPAYGTQWMGFGSGWRNQGPAPVQSQNTGPGAYYAGAYPQQGTSAPPAYAYNENYQQQPQQPGTMQQGSYNSPYQQRSGEAYEMQNYPPPTSPPPALAANGKHV
ncbi:hypothetical protein POJ06DRAFT_26715 [Lipomyces tetrasporus]|uniref:Chitin synthesis regulation, Congo red resistance, RCR protein n=1 Tax=Lipomyces tetrasporus TaxID=54092 RepID=A0AAD7VRB9_9ASCO|nr:uncharacterized protein POJ06DRAFT_26715 [Lipomyces tetrasporus]KAJ8098005.1 hypothetical protein POJ06DRAFT_26715 [Lipomyces tetrasporus]